MDQNDSFVQTLESAVSQLTRKREDEISQHKERLTDLDKRLEAIKLALNGNGASNGNGSNGSQQGISEQRLKRVREYIVQHPRGVRQASIGKRTGLNSGTVSVGLKRLEEAGLVERADHKQNGSQVWVLKEGAMAEAV